MCCCEGNEEPRAIAGKEACICCCNVRALELARLSLSDPELELEELLEVASFLDVTAIGILGAVKPFTLVRSLDLLCDHLCLLDTREPQE